MSKTMKEVIIVPGKDGTGPAGQGNYRGRKGGYAKAGPEGSCICPKCGAKTKHERAEPCINKRCPKCGTAMIRA